MHLLLEYYGKYRNRIEKMPTVNFSCTEQNKEQLKFNLITLLKYGKGNINFMVGREIDKILV